MLHRRFAQVAATALIATATAQESIEYRSLEVPRLGTLQYAVGLPAGYSDGESWPVLLALPDGLQDRATVEAGFERHWREVQRHGFVVVSPIAPDGVRFFEGGERALPALLRALRIAIRVEGSRLHLAGAGDGGRSAFHLATAHPFEFQSLVVLPGYASESDHPRLPLLRDLAVRMFVGSSDDEPWLAESRRTATALRDHGVDVALEVIEGAGRAPATLDGPRIAGLFDTLRQRNVPAPPEHAAIAAMLDDFNDAAAKADADRYFGHFAPDGVFLGTDASERWTIDEFRPWAAFAFERDSAWIFVVQRRHIGVAPDGQTAWFHEIVGSASYGECRGTGTLRRIDGAWQVALYDLTVPIPNPLMGQVVELIRRGTMPGVDSAPTPPTTIYIVRHAEKGEGDDPDLSEPGQRRAAALSTLLADVELSAAYTSQYRRTRQTVGAVVAERGIEPTVIDARDTQGLADRLRSAHRGGAVLVAGHSNTVPELLTALGIEHDILLTDPEYDDLFVVTIGADGTASLQHLHYGPANG